MKKYEKEKKRAIDATLALKEKGSEFNLLIKKKEEIEESLPGLREKTLKAEADKVTAFDNFCLGKVDQKLVDTAQSIYEKAKAAENRKKELLEIIQRRESKVHSELPEFEKEKAEAVGVLWSLIRGELVHDLKALREKLFLTWAANQRSKRPLSYGVVLQNIFDPPPTQVELDPLNETLNSMYEEFLRS